MWVDKRQISSYNPNGTDASGTVVYYWKEWVILAAFLLLFVSTLIVLRSNGRKRIAEQRPLLWFQKFLFPRHLRNGPPYTADPVPLNDMYSGQVRFGHRTQATVAPPPPSYDPYAQALPAYQAKADTSVGTSEVPAQTASAASRAEQADRYTYTIPETTGRR